MTAVSDLTLFAMGVVVAIPTGIVVVSLVFAAGVDEREAAKLRMQRGTGASRPAPGGPDHAVPTA